MQAAKSLEKRQTNGINRCIILLVVWWASMKSTLRSRFFLVVLAAIGIIVVLAVAVSPVLLPVIPSVVVLWA